MVGIAAFSVIAVTAELARRGKRIRLLQGTVVEREARLELQAAETFELTESTLPDAVARLRRGEFPEDVLATLRAPGLHGGILRTVVEAVAAEETLRDSAQRSFVNLARRVQAVVHQQAQELREMEDRHDKTPDVFDDLLRIDHGTALIGRLADSIAVLGGARPGRQWRRPVPLYSVLRGAMSRIIEYQRVELHAIADVAVTGPAVEPLIHALAELIDNATRYSPPKTKVHITAIDVQMGIAVEIEDAGVSLSEEGRQRAERMLHESQQGLDLADLGESPRLGLAVVGRLAQSYGFQVALRTSAYGGVRAVLVIPDSLLTTAANAASLAHGLGGSCVHVTTATSEAVPDESPAKEEKVNAHGFHEGATQPQSLSCLKSSPPTLEGTASGLPRRRKRNISSGEAKPSTPAVIAPVTDKSPEPLPGAWFGAFHEGISGAPATTDDGSAE
ncbi:sensor histidine kinase [Streptomyces vinaceus]